jgi:hypothetical protein
MASFFFPLQHSILEKLSLSLIFCLYCPPSISFNCDCVHQTQLFSLSTWNFCYKMKFSLWQFPQSWAILTVADGDFEVCWLEQHVFYWSAFDVLGNLLNWKKQGEIWDRHLVLLCLSFMHKKKGKGLLWNSELDRKEQSSYFQIFNYTHISVQSALIVR